MIFLGILDWLNPFDLGTQLAQTLVALGTMIMYPFIVTVNFIIDFFNLVITLIYQIVASIVNITAFLWDSLIWTATAILPNSVAVALGIVFALIISIVIYKKIAGISILGFKLPGGK